MNINTEKSINKDFSTMRMFLRSDKLGLVIALCVLCGVLTYLSPVFLSTQNLLNILLSASLVGTIAAAATFVILSGGLDLSVASNVALQGVFAAVLIKAGVSPAITILLTLSSGIVTGVINAFFITEIGINPLITTLGTQQVFRGLAYIISGGSAVYIQNETFTNIGIKSFLGIPNPVIYLIVIFIVFYIVLTKTRFGRNIYVIGGNKEAARLSGINTRKYSYVIYIISGLMAAFGGIVLAARMTSGQPTAAIGLELDAITGVILGGAALNGGVGTMLGTALGVIIMTTFRNGLILLNVNAFYQYIASGLLLLFAVSFDYIRSRKKKTG
jgi:ribose transport system permease protein